MYVALIGILMFAGLALVVAGSNRKQRGMIVLGVSIWLVTAIFFGLLNFWGEMLWFQALGYPQRFWTVVLSKIGLTVVGAVSGIVVVFGLTRPIERDNHAARIWPESVAGLLGAVAGLNGWEVILRYLHRVPAGITDPILNRDAGFYLFSLPFYDLVYRLLFLWSAVALAAAFIAGFLRIVRDDITFQIPARERDYRAVAVPLAALLLVYAWGLFLDRFHLLTSRLGIVAGPGWTDVHVRMPGYLIVALMAVLGAVFLLVPAVRRAIGRFAGRHSRTEDRPRLASLLAPPALVAAVWVLALAVAPILTQWLRVEPNEITMERDYIENNIRFTRYAFGIDDIEAHEFPASERLTSEMIRRNRDLMSEIRLWDYRALADVYKQFQEIRLYYTFPDVDIDRYAINDDYRQVMVSAREMDLSKLAAQSQTFVNRRFKYTHGYGLTLSTVREFTDEGLPNLLVRDIPPKSRYASLEVAQPRIYYGTLTDTHVVANSREKEFDYPSGGTNVYTHYEGQGGVALSSLWRKFIYGWMFDGTRFFLSGYPTRESRILFRRQVSERVKRVAPFLLFEDDPYIVLHEGRLFWIVDAYTASAQFPYSEPFLARERFESGQLSWTRPLGRETAPAFRGANYLRNSVKVVMDAYHGDLSFYVFEPDDPIVKVWRKVFPDLFRDSAEMPDGLRAHVRYPATYLLTQGLVYTKYHMTDPAVFYNQEDLWVRATEKYYQQVQPVEPYYVMWKLPGTADPQFVLILPFSPKNKQVLIGWMAGLCDGENYGRLLAYQFPKEKRILGPQQVETKIDQDSYLSGQLTLWDQRGSKVIRGNVLAIPIEDTLLYVEPIYLQAETAAYPELRLVAVMHGDNLSYAETFEKAIEGLFAPSQAGAASSGARGLIDRAQAAFDDYLRLQAEKQFAAAAAELEKLQSALEQLAAEPE